MDAIPKTKLSNIGVCIMLYGTKEEDGKVINSNGMLEEFFIAKENGSLIIPVGATGGMSAEIATRLINDGYHKEDLLYLLKETDSQKIVDKVLSIVQQNRNNIEGEK